MSGAQALALPRARVQYLLQEAAIFLVLSYVLLLGGTFNGLVLYRLNVANLVVMALSGAAWLGWRWRRAAARPAAGIELGLAAVVAATALATVFSADPRRSAGSLLLLVVYFLIYYLTTDLLSAGWPARLIVRGLLFAGSFVIAFGLLELAAWYAGWLTIGGLQDPLPPATLRVRAFLGHPNFVAALFSLLLPLALGGVLLAQKRATRWAAAGWVSAAAVIVFFTSSRGGWLGTAAGVAALIVLVGAERRATLRGAWQALCRRPWVIAVLGLIALAAVVGAAALVYVQSRHPSHAGRDYIWEVAWEMFQRHPLTGNGPFTYGTEFIRKYSVPPEVLLAHAHNVFINTVAETGLIGAAAWIGLGLALARAMWRRWRAAAGRERIQLAAIVAALAGIGVTSLFDTPELFPALAVFGAIVLALASAPSHSPLSAVDSRISNRKRLIPNTLLSLSWLAACGGLAWSLRAYRGFSDGVLAANVGRWAEAGTTLDEAAARDPEVAFYWLQAGFAHGQAGLRPNGAAGDAGQIAAALADFERGVALEPTLTTNWANLGILRWAAGDAAGAQSALERAVAAAPGETPFRLTLGRLYEARGETELARAALLQSLAERPELSASYFFRATPLRQAVAADWLAQHPGGWLPGGPGMAAGWAHLRVNEFEAARQEFQSISGVNTPDPYLGLGLTYLAEGNYAEASRALRTAQFVPGATGYTDVLIRFASARLAVASGQPDDAIAAYEDGLARLAGTTSFGIGMLGNSDYGWYIFNRESILPDLLPGIDAAPPTDEAVAAMLALGDLYQSTADSASARNWYCQAASAAPDNTLAQARAGGACPGG